jgi:lipopolysaccharide/colanic/teichoic acid biosynthesis glycosyltransferase
MSIMLPVLSETELLLHLPAVENGRPVHLVPHEQPIGSLRFKYALDFCIAVLLLIAAAPLLLVCVILIKLTSRGPAFYSQIRLGRRGRPYWIYKLRTMYHLCETKSGPQWSQNGDPRVTPVGRFLRRTHLDELPQLWNILRGEMSLVGPRPERPEFIPALAKAVPLYAMRMAVRPGVTGLAQVQLYADTNVESVRLKVAYDLYYIENANLWLDARLVVATLFKVFHASFELIRKCFGLPGQAVVEAHSRELQRRTPTKAQPERAPSAPASIEPALVPAQ